MVLSLRAMVRGQPESFAGSRSERGPRPARELLYQTRELHNRIKADILSLPVQQDLQIAQQNLQLAQHNLQTAQETFETIRHGYEQRLTVTKRRMLSLLILMAALTTALLGMGALKVRGYAPQTSESNRHSNRSIAGLPNPSTMAR
jgi:hypothetical protein